MAFSRHMMRVWFVIPCLLHGVSTCSFVLYESKGSSQYSHIHNSYSIRLSACLSFGLISTFSFHRTVYPGSCLSMHLNKVLSIYSHIVLSCFHICDPEVYFDSPKRTFKEPIPTIIQRFHRDGEVSMI